MTPLERYDEVLSAFWFQFQCDWDDYGCLDSPIQDEYEVWYFQVCGKTPFEAYFLHW